MGMHSVYRLAAVFVVALLYVVPAFAADPDVKQLQEAISGSDVDQQKKAVEAISETLSADAFSPQFIGALRDQLIPAMQEKQMYDPIASISQLAMVHNPVTANHFAAYRTKALMALGRNNEALVASKVYFNVGFLSDTSKAIQLVSHCLMAADKDHGLERAQQFRMEERAGTATQPDTSATTQPAFHTSSVLKSIVIDPKPYEEQIAKISDDSDNVDEILRKANLLLMADRCQEAEKLLQRQLAVGDDQSMPRIADGIARAIRAEDGTIGRANAFVISLNAKAGS